MQLFQLPFSHYSAKVRIVILEKGLPVELAAIPGNTQSSDEYKAINPTGLVPCLVDGEFVLSESEVIAEYLEDSSSDIAMLPASPIRRAQSRWLSRMHDLRLAPQLSVLFGLTQTENVDPKKVDQEINSLYEVLDLIESSIEPDPYFFGDRFCISDASYVLSGWYATFLTGALGRDFDQKRYPKFLCWHTAASARPSSQKVLQACWDALGIQVPAKKSA